MSKTKTFMTTEQYVDADPAAFLAAVRDLEVDKNRRNARASAPQVLTYEPADDSVSDLVPPGTVTVFVAPQGSEFLEEVRNAYGRGDPTAVARLAERAVADAKGRQRTTFRQAARDLAAGRPYGDLRYRGKTLAECLGLPNNIAFGVLPVAYIGGDLDDDAFSFVQYTDRASPDDELDVVLVKRAPHLSEIEREVLEKARDRFREGLQVDEMLLGPGGRVAVTVTTITIALFVVAVHTPTLTGGMDEFTINERFARAGKLAEARVKALGAAATVGDLVAARAETLSQSY